MDFTPPQIPDLAQGHVVLRGMHKDLIWRIEVTQREDGLISMLDTFRNGKLVGGGGMGGAPLKDDKLVDYYRGVADEVPWSVLVRTDPSVISVTALTERGHQIPIRLSPVILTYGLRFGATYLDDGDAPTGLLVETPRGVTTEMGTLLLQPPPLVLQP